MTPEQEKRVEEIREAINDVPEGGNAGVHYVGRAIVPGCDDKIITADDDIRFLLSIIAEQEQEIKRLRPINPDDREVYCRECAHPHRISVGCAHVQPRPAPNEFLIECPIEDIPKRKPNFVIDDVDAPEPLDTGEYRADFRTKEEAERGAYQEKPYPPEPDYKPLECCLPCPDFDGGACSSEEFCEKWFNENKAPAPAPQTVEEVKKRLEEMGYDVYSSHNNSTERWTFWATKTGFVDAEIICKGYGATELEAALNLWNAATERMK